MLTALKWSGTSVTVGSLVAATTVRVIAGGAGRVCAVPEAGSAIAPSNNSPVILNRMIASQVQRIIGAPYSLPAPLGMASRSEPGSEPGESGEFNHAAMRLARYSSSHPAVLRRRRIESLPGAFRVRL